MKKQSLAAVALVAATFAWCNSASAQTVVVGPNPLVSYGPVVTRYYTSPVVSPPITTNYAPAVVAPAPVTTYYAPVAPVTTYYAPAPVVTYRAPVATYHAPIVTYRAPVVYSAPVYSAPVVVAPYAVVRPKVYIPGQPIRNFVRAITP